MKLRKILSGLCIVSLFLTVPAFAAESKSSPALGLSSNFIQTSDCEQTDDGTFIFRRQTTQYTLRGLPQTTSHAYMVIPTNETDTAKLQGNIAAVRAGGTNSIYDGVTDVITLHSAIQYRTFSQNNSNYIIVENYEGSSEIWKPGLISVVSQSAEIVLFGKSVVNTTINERKTVNLPLGVWSHNPMWPSVLNVSSSIIGCNYTAKYGGGSSQGSNTSTYTLYHSLSLPA